MELYSLIPMHNGITIVIISFAALISEVATGVFQSYPNIRPYNVSVTTFKRKDKIDVGSELN